MLAVASALDRNDDEALQRLAGESAATLARLRREGARIAWATQTDADRDAELIEFCTAQLEWHRAGALTGAEMIAGANTWLRAHGYAEIHDDTVHTKLTDALLPLDDDRTPAAFARSMLKALGATAAELKNFGAGVKQRERRKPALRLTVVRSARRSHPRPGRAGWRKGPRTSPRLERRPATAERS